jgi:hypothetical protein
VQFLKSALSLKKLIKRKTLMRVMLIVELISFVCDVGDCALTLIVFIAVLYDSVIDSNKVVSSIVNSSFLFESLLKTSLKTSLVAHRVVYMLSSSLSVFVDTVAVLSNVEQSEQQRKRKKVRII